MDSIAKIKILSWGAAYINAVAFPHFELQSPFHISISKVLTSHSSFFHPHYSPFRSLI